MFYLPRTNIDGVPLDLASKLLPKRTRLNMNLSMHIHIHASAQKKYADQSDQIPTKQANDMHITPCKYIALK